jgi:hypothetical protein
MSEVLLGEDALPDCLLHVRLLGLFFCPEDGVSMLLRSVSEPLPDYTALLARRYYPITMILSHIRGLRDLQTGFWI